MAQPDPLPERFPGVFCLLDKLVRSPGRSLQEKRLLEMMEKRLEMEALHRKDSWIARVDVKHHVLAYDIKKQGAYNYVELEELL